MGKVYQISSISYRVWWATVCGEMGTKDGRRVLRARASPPWAPHRPPGSFPALANGCAPRGWWVPSLSKNKQSQAQSALAQGREEGCVCRGRKKGGSVILLENKLHPLSIFIEDPERSSTRPGVCGLNGDVSLFLFFNFCSLFSFLKSFILLFLFTFLVTKTKIRNRKAVFQADSPVKGSRDLAW